MSSEDVHHRLVLPQTENRPGNIENNNSLIQLIQAEFIKYLFSGAKYSQQEFNCS